MLETFKEFTFDAAHHLAANAAPGHAYARMHGHSFAVQVWLRGAPDPKTGWLADFAAMDRAIAPVRARLDHHCLNEIEGLELPTLEHIAAWIWKELKPALPQLHRIAVTRGSPKEGCTYEG